jgi:hypothetical protein
VLVVVNELLSSLHSSPDLLSSLVGGSQYLERLTETLDEIAARLFRYTLGGASLAKVFRVFGADYEGEGVVSVLIIIIISSSSSSSSINTKIININITTITSPSAIPPPSPPPPARPLPSL